MRQSDFNKFSSAKAPEKPCPECGTNKWSLIGKPDPEKPGDGVLTLQMTIGDDGSGFGTYPIFCTNCGYVKHYAANIVQKWVEENG